MYESLGTLFRKTRMERSLDISEVAQETRIPPETIRAIEADDYGALPALAFARGFYSLYAQALGLNPDEVLQRFAEEYQVDDYGVRKREPYTTQWQGKDIGSIAERPTNSAGPIIGISLLVIILAAALISWYAGYNPAKQISNWLRSFQQQPEVEIVREQQQPTVESVTELQQPAAETLAEQQQAAETAPEYQPSPPEGTQSLEESSTEELPAEPAQTIEEAVDQPLQEPMEAVIATVEEARYQLVAEFQDPAEIVISLDGEEPQDMSMTGGTIETWQAHEKIVLELPPEAAVRLYLNGIVVPLPPAENDRVTVAIPDYFLE